MSSNNKYFNFCSPLGATSMLPIIEYFTGKYYFAVAINRCSDLSASITVSTVWNAESAYDYKFKLQRVKFFEEHGIQNS